MRKPTPKTKSKPAKEAVLPTRVVFLLDRSGSMQSVKDETIVGFNSYLDSLKPGKSKTTITAVQFDTLGIDAICSGVDPKSAPRLNSESYSPRGGTPLYDAIGKTITDTKDKVSGHKVLFVILTDGQENSSTEWSKDRVKSLMSDREKQDQWTFAYIGMGPAGWAAQRDLSSGLISHANVMNVNQNKAGNQRAYGSLARATSSYAGKGGAGIICNFWSGEKDEE